MIGESVTVKRPFAIGSDEFNEPIVSYSEERVDDVLVCPHTAGNGGEQRDGSVDTITLHFPKTYSGELYGCSVTVRGRDYDVDGNPMRWTPENCPTRWNMEAKVVRANG